MTLEQATEQTRSLAGRVILATSDGSVYINPDVKAIEKHAHDSNLEVYYIKGAKPKLKKEKNGTK